MPSVFIKNLSAATRHAIKMRARAADHSTETEIRLILDNIALSQHKVKLGSMLSAIGQESGGMDWDNLRDNSTEAAVSFE